MDNDNSFEEDNTLKGIEKSDICFLESKSLYNLVLNEINQNQDVALEELGFCALVKFKDILDAVKLFSKEFEIAVPLNFQEKDGMPRVPQGPQRGQDHALQ